MKDKKALQRSAVVSKLPGAVNDKVNNLLANGVVSTSIVVGGVLLARDELLLVEELTVGASVDLIDASALKDDEHATWYVLVGTSL